MSDERLRLLVELLDEALPVLGAEVKRLRAERIALGDIAHATPAGQERMRAIDARLYCLDCVLPTEFRLVRRAVEFLATPAP